MATNISNTTVIKCPLILPIRAAGKMTLVPIWPYLKIKMIIRLPFGIWKRTSDRSKICGLGLIIL